MVSRLRIRPRGGTTEMWADHSLSRPLRGIGREVYVTPRTVGTL